MSDQLLDTHVHKLAIPYQPRNSRFLVSAISYADNFDQCGAGNYKGIGIHPECADQFRSVDKEWIEKQILATNTFVGEVGIDLRKSIVEMVPVEAEQECFEYFCELAFKHKKLISLHVVNRSPGCWDYLLNVFSRFEEQHGGTVIIFHGYSGSYEEFSVFQRQLKDCRLFVGVGWCNESRCKVLNKLKQFIVLETDYYEISENYSDLWDLAYKWNSSYVVANNTIITKYIESEEM